MNFDFTTLNTGGGVHPFVAEHGITDPEIISFSVAEMRLNLAPGIVRGMHEIVDRQCFGYAPPDKDRYNRAVCGWMETRHDWRVRPEWLVQTSGVVSAMGVAIRALTEPGDGVIIQPPVYPPFRRTVEQNGRRVIENPLRLRNGRYEMDLRDLREKAGDAKLLMLCSPHNPVGRVWTAEELKALGEIALESGLYVLSDEIHFDLDLCGWHQVLTQAVPALTDRAIICTAPSKTFNLAGNGLSNIVIPDEDLRERFCRDLHRTCGMYVGTFAYASATAAYETGGPWLDALLTFLKANRAVLEARLRALIPGARLADLEGTYLQWIDLGCLGLSREDRTALLERAMVFVNDGESFGTGGKDHIRFNLACPAAAIEKAMDRLATVL